MLGYVFLGFAVALLWGSIKELLGCLARLLMLGLGALFLIMAIAELSTR